MEKKLIEKTPTIVKRIKFIRLEISAHEKNIQLLNAFEQGSITVEAVQNNIPKNENNYQWTMNNIRTQLMELENELSLLKKYAI